VSAAFGRQVFSGDYRVFYGDTTSVRLNWTNPSGVTHHGAAWRYTLLLQKQAGVTFDLQMSVTLPACATLTSALPLGFRIENGRTLTGRLPLAKDLSLTIEYTC
jgi:hypothetical protein